MGATTTAIAVAAKVKLATLLLADTLVVGGAGAAGATAAAANGTFGQQVKQQVATCKAELKAGTHGIGECVSDFASQHGQQERDQHSHGKGAGGSSNSHGASSNGHGAPANPGKSGDTHGKSSHP
ncbi:MAG TPA: hypothetical protein VIG77_19845 [Ktedonobacterales bacterium]